MTTRDEIKFWQKAKKIIRAGYGKPCRDFALGCAGCQANLAASWIEEHIALLKWELKSNGRTTPRR
jgi:hypothetical protein